MKRTGATSSKAEYNRCTMATDATAPNLAKKTENTLAVDTNRAHTNEESRKNKYSNDMSQSKGKVFTVQPICHECEQKKKLL